MKGLDIAKDFFLNWGKPFLESGFPELTERIAAGRFSGSDVLRADDEISRDHNWGPQFSLFLSEDDFNTYGEAISDLMNSAAPPDWKGYWVDGAGDKNVLVECVPQWIQEYTGFAELPRSDKDWGHIVKHRQHGGSVEGYESSLYYLKHGALWLNNNEEFAHWREALANYPENVWLARLAEETFRMWQYGEYNFVHRVAKRGDPIAVTMSLGKFAEGVMRISLLLDGDFTPYWKWLSYAFRKLDRASNFVPLLESLLGSTEPTAQVELVKQICHDMHQEMLSRGLITGQGIGEHREYLLSLLNAQDELMAKVTWMPPIV